MSSVDLNIGPDRVRAPICAVQPQSPSVIGRPNGWKLPGSLRSCVPPTTACAHRWSQTSRPPSSSAGIHRSRGRPFALAVCGRPIHICRLCIAPTSSLRPVVAFIRTAEGHCRRPVAACRSAWSGQPGGSGRLFSVIRLLRGGWPRSRIAVSWPGTARTYSGIDAPSTCTCLSRSSTATTRTSRVGRFATILIFDDRLVLVMNCHSCECPCSCPANMSELPDSPAHQQSSQRPFADGGRPRTSRRQSTEADPAGPAIRLREDRRLASPTFGSLLRLLRFNRRCAGVAVAGCVGKLN